MKLLSWMHRKLQKDTIGSFQGSAIGSSCTCLPIKPLPKNHEEYVKPCNSKLRHQPQQRQHSLEEFRTTNTEEINREEYIEMFPGFLTIGTLSMEPITEPTTPTFDLPRQEKHEDGMSEMKYDLNLINNELEKFLKAEAKDKGNNDSSSENNHAITMILSSEEKEEVGDYKNAKIQVYPLQGYLLGSSGELPETKKRAKKEKTSLHELFQKSKIADSSLSTKAEGTHKQPMKEFRSSTRLTSKMRQTFQLSPKNSTASTGCAVDSLTVKKLDKIKKLFHKKIHPEITSTNAKERNKFSKHKKIHNNSSHSYMGSAVGSESNTTGCWGTFLKGKENNCSKADMKPAQVIITEKKMNTSTKEMSDGAGTEHWIKTDANYLVLELQKNEDAHY